MMIALYGICKLKVMHRLGHLLAMNAVIEIPEVFLQFFSRVQSCCELELRACEPSADHSEWIKRSSAELRIQNPVSDYLQHNHLLGGAV